VKYPHPEMKGLENQLTPIFVIKYGVVSEKTKLNSHCDNTPIAIPTSLFLAGKISDTYGHGSGPQERLYTITNI
jgi:hypothetical protein